MRWENESQSDNVEDQRGRRRGPQLAVGGGVGALVIALVVFFLGGDPKAILDQLVGGQGAPVGQQAPRDPEEDRLAEFVNRVLKMTEDVWNDQFRKMGKSYEEPRLVLFTDVVDSACGTAQSAMGPFYCPADHKVYIDLSFYKELKSRHHAPGDFAQAYVIAHEVGHHVQNLLGISDRVHAARGRMSEAEFNRQSVRLELQADFLAGLWAHYADEAKKILEAGDIEEALNAASAIGDDRLQREARGRVVPETFTHGTSAQRVRWFKLGLETGDMSKGDTFNARDL
jgi:predicted metalloprotease